jgi:hypothetical protein
MQSLRNRPILTKSTTASSLIFYDRPLFCSVILATGDVIAQNVEMNTEGGQYKLYSPFRTLRMAIVGFTVIGFQVHM